MVTHVWNQANESGRTFHLMKCTNVLKLFCSVFRWHRPRKEKKRRGVQPSTRWWQESIPSTSTSASMECKHAFETINGLPVWMTFNHSFSTTQLTSSLPRTPIKCCPSCGIVLYIESFLLQGFQEKGSTGHQGNPQVCHEGDGHSWCSHWHSSQQSSVEQGREVSFRWLRWQQLLLYHT